MSDAWADTDTPYGYTPTRWVTIVFIVLFGLSALLHTGQAIRYRTWWMIPTMVLCTLAETIGWGGRLWSTFSPRSLDPFLMQICCTIFAPSFMTAATFTILSKIIPRLGTQYSWLTPKWYLIIFLTADIGALVIQSVGGAQAATAAKGGNNAEQGGRIMVGGIIFQMVAITLFVICAVDFLLRYHLDRPVRVAPPKQHEGDVFAPAWGGRGTLDKGTKLMILGLIINTVFIYIRSIYRTIELLDGWNGPIIANQLLFNVLDGFPIVTACFTFNVFHPGRLLGPDVPAPSSTAPRSGDDTPYASGNFTKEVDRAV